MKILWTSKAQSDLGRLYAFLAPLNPSAAARAMAQLYAAPEKLFANPRIGEQLTGFGNREVRRILVGKYELRYEIRDSAIAIIRVRHTREQL
ncbi:type II toxin-antitoxin system RelE/ParE family toxin [Pseudoduganella aquatica]|uniref:Type II toxin-antitoxin system RelE/ParE family toxin n=1 Tax=Pseudoduganella aquatica TaxID=2660641 RepID=A0A7X4KLC4_9BURK|nr:type II toxin-antitoxin system RelE/ParE family toxin [Pseudoduganella aquatica]MYN06928.1 type II toxin-antitoxin system RelE/ParE family toxin [Pseudoduganella aquatica]